MQNKPYYDLKVITKGAPKFSNLTQNELKTFLACLELQIKEYYADIQNGDRIK